MEHYGGWKWWKKDTPDMEQVLLEIVDIWHFGMSCLLQNERDQERLASNIASSWKERRSDLSFREIVEALAAEAETAGGVILPGTAGGKPQEGKVM